MTLLAATPLGAELDCVMLRPDLRPASASSIGLFPDSRLPLRVARQAVAAWAGCSAYGFDLPPLELGRGGTRDLLVTYDPQAIGSGERCGSFSGRTITLFSRTRTESGAVVRCGSLAQNLTHELGHALGLADSPRACRSFAMSKLGPRNIYHRRLRAAECKAVHQRWNELPRLAVSRVNR